MKDDVLLKVVLRRAGWPAGPMKERFATLDLVGGCRPYLWIGDDDGGCYATTSGPGTLRALAKAILRSLPKKRKTVKR